jgi:hypothetical protein
MVEEQVMREARIMHSDGEAGGVPRPVGVAGSLMVAVGVVVSSWAALAWMHNGSFDSAANAVFGPPKFAFPDADFTLAELEVGYVIGPILGTLFGAWMLVLGVRKMQGRGGRFWSLSASTLALIFASATLLANGQWYIRTGNTGASDARTAAAVRHMDALTPWRFSGWYHSVTVGTGWLAAVALVSVIALLTLSVSSSYFRHGKAR